MDERLYDQLADVGDVHWWFEGRRQIVEAVLRDALGSPPPDADAPPRRILELGCGTGAMLGMLTRFGTVSALEMYPDAVEFCRSKYADDVDVQLGSIPDDVPCDGDLDLVAAFDVIEHLEDDAGALRSMRAALRPGGLLVLTVPAFPFLWGRQDVLSHHYRRYRLRQLRGALLSGGFEIERTTYFNTWLFPAAAAVRVSRRLFGRHADAGSDLDTSSPRADRVLTRVFASERHVLRRRSLPVGVSLLALARRPSRD